MLKMPNELSPEEIDILTVRVGQVFSPHTPINQKQFFSGRKTQLQQLLDSVFQVGQHIIIFGERGVGKTSLATVLPEFIKTVGIEDIITCRINCVSEDTTEVIWKRVFSEIEVGEVDNRKTITEIIGKQPITPHLIQQQLKSITSGENIFILIFDEIDTIHDQHTKRAFAETIKTLSDHAIKTTIMLVGVSDDVDKLILEHQSIERNLVQIHMPRMSILEIGDILITNGLDQLRMGIEDECVAKILKIAQGLPHYAHLLGRNSARAAIEQGLRNINEEHVNSAIKQSIEQAQQSIKSAYIKAISSPRKNLYAQVILACALAESDELGRFAAVDVRDPFRMVMKKNTYGIPNFAKNLTDLCDLKRGKILEKSGQRRSYRYKFTNPLMQSYVIMRGLQEKAIDQEVLNN